MNPALPPCIVLGLESQIGLGIVRELGRAGVPVIGLARGRDDLGLASRYLVERIVFDEHRGPELIRRIRAIGARHPQACLLGVSEADLLWLARHREELLPVKAIVPPLECLEAVIDKSRTLEVARGLGLPVPQTLSPATFDEALAATRTSRFPVVLKWRDPAEVADSLRLQGLPLIKAEYARTGAELEAIVRRYAPIGHWPLVQQYAPGVGLGQFFYMHEGRALRRFQHVRVAEWPPEGGFSSVCDALPLDLHARLQEQSIELLRALGWEGVAMVEYRHDPATGQSVLMEVNGRFWGSFPLAVHSGAGFALMAYLVQGLGRDAALPAAREDLRCRMIATEVKRLVRLLFQRDRIQDPSFEVRPLRELARFAGDFFKPRVRYYVWSADDPRPFFTDVANAMGRAIGRA